MLKIEVKTGETAVLELKNENVKGELEITKVDVADGNTKLPNAEFTIYNEQGKEVVKGKRMKRCSEIQTTIRKIHV